MSEEKGGECLVIKADVRCRQKSFDAVEKCVKKIGGLNILVNNAAFQTSDVPNLYICDNSVSRRRSRSIRLDDYGLWAVAALGQHNLEYGTATRKVLTVAKPFAAVGIAVAGVFALTTLVRKLTENSERRD